MTIQFSENYAIGRVQTKFLDFSHKNQRKTLQNNFTKRNLNKEKTGNAK